MNASAAITRLRAIAGQSLSEARTAELREIADALDFESAVPGHDRLAFDFTVSETSPVVRGTRVTAQTALLQVAVEADHDACLAACLALGITPQDLGACFRWSSEIVTGGPSR